MTMIGVPDRFADFDISSAACKRQFIESDYARLIQVAVFRLLSHRISSNFNSWRSCGIHAEYDYEFRNFTVARRSSIISFARPRSEC